MLGHIGHKTRTASIADRHMKLQDSIEQVEGHLQSLEDQQFDHLVFDWEGIHFKAASEAKQDGSAVIRLTANLGRLYFTIENTNHRTMAIERLYSNNRAIDGAYSIDASGEVLFQSLTNTPSKLVGKDLTVAITTILLQSETHLRTLRSHLKPTKNANQEKAAVRQSSSAAA